MRTELTPEEEQDAIAFGLVKTYAFHCTRCNYVWLPKDYDYEHENIMQVAWSRTPKSCARCKSKYWRQERVNQDAITKDRPMGLLHKWVEKTVKMGRKEGYSDRKIASLIVAYGRKGNYSNFQISEALRENGVKRYIGRIVNNSSKRD